MAENSFINSEITIDKQILCEYNYQVGLKDRMTSKQGGVRTCLYALKIKHQRRGEIREEQTGRWLLRLSLNVLPAANRLCRTEYARTADPTTSARSLFRKKHSIIPALRAGFFMLFYSMIISAVLWYHNAQQ